MPNTMQLTALFFAILTLATLFVAMLFVVAWQRAHNQARHTPLIREGIGHIGISTIVLYPSTVAPLYAILEEEYPRSEAVVVTDFDTSPFYALLHHFKLIRVNHSHLAGVRGLYRSRHRSVRRIVVLDIPHSQRDKALVVAKEVASFDNCLYLEGESLIAYNTLAYCAKEIARYPTERAFRLRSVVGDGVVLERGEETDVCQTLISDRILAWRRVSFWPVVAVLLLPSLFVVMARLTEVRLFLLSALVMSLTITLFIYLSLRLASERGVVSLLAMIVKNFYRFSREKIGDFHSLCKECRIKSTGKGVRYLLSPLTVKLQQKSKDEPLL